MGLSKQMRLLLLLLLLNFHGTTDDRGAAAVVPTVVIVRSPASSRRRLSIPESVHDKQEVVSTTMSPDLAEEMVCEPSGPCRHCGGQDSESVPECKATGRRQAFRCWSTEGDTTESSDVGPEETDAGDPFTVYRSCQRTDDDEEFRLLRFQLFCFMGGIASFMQVRKQKALSASLFDQRKQHHQQSTAATATTVEMVETQALVSNNNSRDEADVV